MATTIAVPQTGELPKVKTPEFNDRDRINDMLSYEKYLTAGYSTGLNEMQNAKLRQTIGSILQDAHQTEFQLFDLMFQKGWYKMKAADKQEIAQAHQQFSNYKSQIPTFS